MKHIALLIVALLVTPRAFAAVTYDTVTTTTANGASSISWSHAVAAGSNLAIFCDGAFDDFFTGSTIAASYNGSSMSLQQEVAPSSSKRLFSWVSVAPASGSHSAAITVSNNSHVVASCRSYSGVNQGVPIGTIVTDSNSGGGALSAAITVGSGGQGYDLGLQSPAGNCQGQTVSGSAGQTERYDLCEPIEATVGGFGSTNSNTGALTHSWTIAADGAYVALIAFPINAAAAASSARPRRIIRLQ